jgi:hypothetical protein
VHDAGTARILAARDAPPEERINQRPRRIPGPGMHHEPRRLVNHKQMLVLKDHRNGYLLR